MLCSYMSSSLYGVYYEPLASPSFQSTVITSLQIALKVLEGQVWKSKPITAKVKKDLGKKGKGGGTSVVCGLLFHLSLIPRQMSAFLISFNSPVYSCVCLPIFQEAAPSVDPLYRQRERGKREGECVKNEGGGVVCLLILHERLSRCQVRDTSFHQPLYDIERV